MSTDAIRRIEKLEAQIAQRTAVCNCDGKALRILREEDFPDGVRPDTTSCEVHGEPLVVILGSLATVTDGRVTAI